VLIDRCLCGETEGAVEVHGEVKALRCRCGVARLLSGLNKSQYEQQYNDGSYHTSIERHPGCVPYKERYERDLRVAKIRTDRYREIVRSRWAGRIRVLDVGCANGAFVHYLRSVGVQAMGIDKTPRVPRWCIRGSVQSVRLRRNMFEFVTYHDVLEHILDPAAELKGARGLTAEGGVLVVDVPDVSVPEGSHHWKPEHVWYFTAQSLRNLLEGSGFNVLHEDRPIPGKLVMYGSAA
jgi:SAM-dependent methyltransferase